MLKVTPISFFIQSSLISLSSFNFRDAQYKIDTSLLKVPATEQRNSQPDKDIRRHPKNSPTGEITWQGEQQIDEEGHNEKRQHCANCHLLESEYGRVLFERDLAQRNLRLASYRFADELQRQRNSENNGMDLMFFPSSEIYLLRNSRQLPTPDPSLSPMGKSPPGIALLVSPNLLLSASRLRRHV